MIVRILGEGQFDVSDDDLTELNRLDNELQTAVQTENHEAFSDALAALLTGVRTLGKEVPSDYLGPSELVLPSPDSSLEEVRDLLADSEGGLIPG